MRCSPWFLGTLKNYTKKTSSGADVKLTRGELGIMHLHFDHVRSVRLVLVSLAKLSECHHTRPAMLKAYVLDRL